MLFFVEAEVERLSNTSSTKPGELIAMMIFPNVLSRFCVQVGILWC